MAVNLFNANFYRAANPDLAAVGLTTDALLSSHFQTNGLDEGRAFSPFVNLDFYRSSNPDLVADGYLNTNRQAFDDLQNFGVSEGRLFSEFVDINYYLSFNSDVNQAIGGDTELALEHLQNFGVSEGRSFSPYVDLDYYLSTNSDVNQVTGGNRARALEHLEINGVSEGRQFSPAFDVNFYRNTYPDLTSAGLTANRLLFQHWVSNGANLDDRSGTPDPGNSLDTALNLRTPPTSATLFNDFVSSSDTNDYYRLTLNESRDISLDIFGLSADLDLALLDNTGNAIASSSGDGAAGDSINYFGSNAGTYFIRVNQGVPDASSKYTIVTAVLPSQDPGADISDAYSLGSAFPPSNTLIQGSVGGSDTDDYYEVSLSRNSSLNAQLTPKSANADLYLLNSSGATISSSTTGSTALDSIPSTSLTTGTYFVRISGSSDNTGYSLNVSFA